MVRRRLTIRERGLLLTMFLWTILSGNVLAEVHTFETGKQPVKEIHVTTDGSDENGDGTTAHPFATVRRAVQEAAPGSAVRIHPGTYNHSSYISGLTGSAQAPVWIGGVPGEAKPVFDGLSQPFHFVRVRYLIVHDLEIRNCRVNGINCDDGGLMDDPDATRFVVFRDLRITRFGSGGNEDGLKLSGVDDYVVHNCEFKDFNGDNGSGIDHVGCHNGLIAENHFENMAANAIQCKGGSRDIDIRGNTFLNAGQRSINIGGSTGYTFFRPPLSTGTPNVEARAIRIYANVFEGSITPLAFVGTVESVAANNTIINPVNWLFRILQETVSDTQYEFLPCADNRLINNIFYFDSSGLRTSVNIGPNTNGGSFIFSNNLWYAHDNPADSAPDLPAVETAAIIGQDPLFTGFGQTPRALDLRETSPAIDQGAELSPDFSTDMSGARRPRGNGWDVGAYEYIPESGLPSVPSNVKVLKVQ